MEENASVLGATICLEGLDCVLESRYMFGHSSTGCHSYICSFKFQNMGL